MYLTVIRPVLRLYNESFTEVTDEVLSGFALEVLEETEPAYRVRTHYGYTGYIRREGVKEAALSDIKAREESGTVYTVTAPFADVLAENRVQSERLTTLYRGSLVIADPEAENGFRHVRTAFAEEGYLPENALMKRPDSDLYFWAEDKETCLTRLPALKKPEGTLRNALCDTARRYLATPYRWGGKTPEGLDCSGFVSMVYMLNGVLIHRDSAWQAGYPVRKIPREQIRKGDLMYFPGHIALYLGGGEYIHCSAYRYSFGCCVNSLDPKSPLYRADLVDLLRHGGTVFGTGV